MAVNTNVYGTSEQWFDSFCETYITNKDKIAYFGENMSRLENGVTANKLSYDAPIDKSLSYCGLGEESALSHIGYCYQDNGEFKIVEWEDRFVTNFAFMQQNDRNISMSSYYRYFDLRNDELQKRCFWQPTRASNNMSPKLQPYTKINPKNFVLLIKVQAYNATFTGSPKDVTLAEYMADWKDTYPCINAVYIEAYFNTQLHTESNPIRAKSSDLSTLNVNQLTMQYCQLDAYNVTGKNMTFYSYYLGNQPIMGSYIRSGQPLWGSNRDLRFIAATENCKEHCKISTSSYNETFTYIEYFDGILDEILKTVACFGLYFTDTENVATSGKLTNNNMFIGLLDDNGIGHGNYLRGAETVNAPQNNYTDMTQSGYDYTKEIDKTKYDNSTNFNLSLSLGAFTKFYQLSESQVNDLCTALYEAVNAQPSGTTIEEYNMKCFLTNNPIDCIISLKKFPLNHFPFVGVPNDVYLGTVDTGIDAPQLLTTTWVYYFDFLNSSDTGLYPVFGGSFLDFEPYTTIQINVPFCGSFEVPTTYFHKYNGVRVALMIDFITGACTAYLMVNNDVVDSISGSCAVDLPVTGLQSATLNGNIHNTAMMKEQQQTSLFSGLIAGAVSIGVGLATGSLPLAVGGGAAIIGSFMKSEDTGKQINYNVEHMQLPLKQVGSASGAIAQCNDYRCKMIIKRPVLMPYDEEVYACTIGYACLLNGTVNNFTGLTIGKIEAETIQNGITDEERAMIESLFASGVIL